MEKFVVHGPCKLQGTVNISGAKNAAVGIIPATLLVNGKCHLENVPDISDIRAYFEISSGKSPPDVNSKSISFFV